MKRRVVSRGEYCMDCRLCQVACIVAHHPSRDIHKAFRLIEDPVEASVIERRSAVTGMSRRRGGLPRTIVELREGCQISTLCRHCDEADCVSACITGAMRRMPDGRITVDEDRCVGCWSCVMICSWGAIERRERSEERHGAVRRASKCDLCGDRENPACVEICPNEALVLEETEE